ncbi:hypothetical protein CNMCM5623_004363 [Aspergillus felis]|uniref:Ricin B lectin domain-containing protein n=1 Tax=Aspergillus felis TaxID=1287682 RepID=A0A8H6QHM2_9EURO|nr:hypothetical protein CNMCM5623_004363 [Aspergillus felis]
MTVLHNRAYYLVNRKYGGKVFHTDDQNLSFRLHNPGWLLTSSQVVIAHRAPITGHIIFIMGDNYLTMVMVGGKLKLALEEDPRRLDGSEPTDQYQYWKLVKLSDESGKDGFQIQNAATGDWLEVSGSGMSVDCGTNEVGNETLWDLVLLPTTQALLKGLPDKKKTAKKTTVKKSSRDKHSEAPDEGSVGVSGSEDNRNAEGSEDDSDSVLNYSDNTYDHQSTVIPEPIWWDKHGIAHQSISMHKS